MPSLLPQEDTPPLPSLPAASADLAQLAGVERLGDVLDTGLLVTIAHRHRGRHAAALEHARRLLDLATFAYPSRPADVARHHPEIQLAVGTELMLTGDTSAALTALRYARRLGASGSGRSAQNVTASAASLLGLLHSVLGEVGPARHWLAELRAAADRAPIAHNPDLAHIHVASGTADLLVAVDEMDFDTADAAYQRLSLLDSTNLWLDLWAYVAYAQAHHALHRGDIHAALDQIARAQATHRHDLDDGVAAPLLAAAQANLLIASGRGNQARRCLRSTPVHGLLRVPAARLALLGGDTTEAMRLAADQTWERTAGTRDRAEMRLIQAVAARRAGDLALARTALRRVIRVARSAGLRSVWATVPRDELDELARHTPEPDDALPKPPQAPAHDVYPTSVVLIELTEREREVLDQLAAGATLDHAAATLAISYNTIKTHVASIYRKLDVDSRRAAVAAAQRLGLLGVIGR